MAIRHRAIAGALPAESAGPKPSPRAAVAPCQGSKCEGALAARLFGLLSLSFSPVSGSGIAVPSFFPFSNTFLHVALAVSITFVL